MRKLASVQTVNAVEPIPTAEAIERARVLGWWVVVKKGEFRVGDKIVYCEIDALLPERPAFEFLRAGSFKPAVGDQRAGFRVRTVKLRGQVSQGICFPLSVLPADAPTDEGADVTVFLEIIKYEPPLPVGMGGKVKGAFPAFLPKTDETRVQVLEEVLTRHRGKTFHLTEKLDGTSFTAFLRHGEFGICSRNLWMDETDPGNVLAKVTRRLDLPAKLAAIRAAHGFDPAVQGEIIGPGIQGNKYALKGADLWVFNLLNLDTGTLVDTEPARDMMTAVGLVPVPYLGPLELNHTVDELVQLAVGKSVLNPNVHREGVVFRPAREEFDETIGGRLSFKAINPQFLLKYDE